MFLRVLLDVQNFETFTAFASLPSELLCLDAFGNIVMSSVPAQQQRLLERKQGGAISKAGVAVPSVALDRGTSAGTAAGTLTAVAPAGASHFRGTVSGTTPVAPSSCNPHGNTMEEKLKVLLEARRLRCAVSLASGPQLEAASMSAPQQQESLALAPQQQRTLTLASKHHAALVPANQKRADLDTASEHEAALVHNGASPAAQPPWQAARAPTSAFSPFTVSSTSRRTPAQTPGPSPVAAVVHVATSIDAATHTRRQAALDLGDGFPVQLQVDLRHKLLACQQRGVSVTLTDVQEACQVS